MITEETKEKIGLFRKWLGNMAKEFIDLPYRQQERVIGMINSFVNKCNSVHLEQSAIYERLIILQITDIYEKENCWIVTATAENMADIIMLKYPKKPSHIHVGKKILHMVYSLDGKEWYSSKSLLVNAR